MPEFDLTLILAIAAGIAIASAAGLRAFLPLFALGLAARFGLVRLTEGAQWLSGDLSLWALGAATLVEIAGDKIPIVDHALDAIGTVVRPAAAWLGAYAVLYQLPTPYGQLLAVVLGAGALAVHAAKAKVRLGSSAATLGAANPALSVLEDGLAFAIVASAILIPLVALLGLATLVWLAWWIAGGGRRREREA